MNKLLPRASWCNPDKVRVAVKGHIQVVGRTPEARSSFPSSMRGVCEGVEKRSFLTAMAIKPCGKKDRFSNCDGYVKRIQHESAPHHGSCAAMDFLGPAAGGMGKEREYGVGLVRLGMGTRIGSAHGNSS